MRPLVVALIGTATVACSGGQLGPSQALDSDPFLRDLPADATLVAGANLRLLRQSPLVHVWLAEAGTGFDSIERSLCARAGLRAGAEAPGDLRIGCGPRGCAGLVAGDLSGFSLERTARAVNRAGEPEQGPRALDPPMALRRIAPDRALVGDEAVVAAAAPGAPGLDPSALAGAVPAGDVWIAARDANLVFEQMAVSFERSGTEEGRRIAERLRAPSGPHRQAAEMLDVFAFSVDGREPMTARARATCRSAAAAVVIEQMARAALLRIEAGGPTETVRRAARDTTVVRVGNQVELSLTRDAAGVLAALEEAREARP